MMMVRGRRLPMTARLRWRPQHGREQAALDFVRHLFEGQLVAPAETLEGPSTSYYRDTYERIGHMAVRGCLSYLVHAGGWAQVRHVDVSGERLATGRLWDAPQLSQLRPELGADVLLLCMELFEAFARRRLDAQRAHPASFVRLAARVAEQGNAWEQLVLHLLTRPLAMLNQAPEAVAALCRGASFNTLTIAAHPGVEVALEASAVTRALDAWGWTLPWISEEIAWWWQQADQGRFSAGLERFDVTVERLATLLEAVLDHALEAARHDWLLAVVDFFSHSYGGEAVEDAAGFASPLEALTEGASLRERQAHRDAWGRMLRVMSALGRERARIQRSHPVDREVHERLFLAYWEESGADLTLERVERLRGHLERVIS